MEKTIFKVGDTVKIEGVLEASGASTYSLKLFLNKPTNTHITFDKFGRYHKDGTIVLQMVKPAPEELKVGQYRISYGLKCKILDIVDGVIFYRWFSFAPGIWKTNTLKEKDFLKQYPTVITKEEGEKND